MELDISGMEGPQKPTPARYTRGGATVRPVRPGRLCIGARFGGVNGGLDRLNGGRAAVIDEVLCRYCSHSGVG